MNDVLSKKLVDLSVRASFIENMICRDAWVLNTPTDRVRNKCACWEWLRRRRRRRSTKSVRKAGEGGSMRLKERDTAVVDLPVGSSSASTGGFLRCRRPYSNRHTDLLHRQVSLSLSLSQHCFFSGSGLEWKPLSLWPLMHRRAGNHSVVFSLNWILKFVRFYFSALSFGPRNWWDPPKPM